MHRQSSRRLAAALAFVATACTTAAADKPNPLPPITPIMIPPAMPAGGGEDLAGRAWSWQGTTFAGQRSVAPDAAERYTIEFMPDGRAQLRADCNRGNARYETGADRALRLGPAAVTKIGCPAGSKDGEFLRQLGDVAGYRFAGGDLVLVLKSDAGAMRFAPASR